MEVFRLSKWLEFHNANEAIIEVETVEEIINTNTSSTGATNQNNNDDGRENEIGDQGYDFKPI